MHCRECGEKYLNDNAVICIKCGVKRDKGNNFCPECGQSVSTKSDVCLNCGVSLRRKKQIKTNVSSKSKVAAALFAFFLGALGIHRFYLGYTTLGIVYIVLFILGFLTIGITWIIVGIWAFIEFILILCGVIKDVNGEPLS